MAAVMSSLASPTRSVTLRGERGAHDRDADRAAEAAEEGDSRARDADLGRLRRCSARRARGSASSCRRPRRGGTCRARRARSSCRSGWSTAGTSRRSARREPTMRYGFHLPKRVMSAPTPIDDSSRPAIIGIVMRPASVGVAPRASCMYWLRKTDAPNIAMPVAIDAMTDEREGAVAEQRERDERLLRAQLDDDEQRPSRGRAPPTMRTVSMLHHSNESPARVTQMSRSETAADEQHDAEVVDARLPLRARGQVQRALQDDERGDRERERDEEVPAPAERVGDDAAEQRAADRGDGHDAAEEAHVPAALARADDVGHDDLAERGEAAGADALHRAEGDERRRCPARSRRPRSRARRSTIASWMSSLRLNRSASLPQIGVEIAVVSRVAVMTQVKAVWSPPRSWMMTGSDVETTVDASIDTNMPSRRPERAWSTSRCGAAGVGRLRSASGGEQWTCGSFGSDGTGCAATMARDG